MSDNQQSEDDVPPTLRVDHLGHVVVDTSAGAKEVSVVVSGMPATSNTAAPSRPSTVQVWRDWRFSSNRS